VEGGKQCLLDGDADASPPASGPALLGDDPGTGATNGLFAG
jgi:hypothetical protein